MRAKLLAAAFVLVLVNLFFFRPVWLRGEAPFPGDLLLAEYSPWKSYSYFGYSPGAIPNKAQSFDTLRQLYPWRNLAIQSFKQGEWPLWNPYNFSGAPLLANFQTAAFYPLNVLYFLFPFNLAWVFQVLLQPFLASFFFFLLARRLKISFYGGLLGAIAFGYSSFMTVWLEYNTIGQVILWLPLVLLAIELLIESFSFFRISLLVFSLTLSFLAGHPQDFGTLWLFGQIYLLARVLFLGFSKHRFLWLKIFLVSFFPFFLGAAQFLPTLELILNSARSPLSQEFLLKKVLLQPWQLINTLVPDYFGNPATRNYFLEDTYIGKVLYIGLLPLAFSFLAIFRKKNFWIWFFFSAAVICLVLTIASPLTGFLYSLPFFSTLSPTRILYIFQFSLAVLAGFGLDFFIKTKISFKKKLMPIGIIGFILLFALVFASGLVKTVEPEFLASLNVVRRNLFFSGILFLATIGLMVIGIWLIKKKSQWRKSFLIIMIVFVVVDLFRFFNKITPFSPLEFIYPQAEVLTFLQTKSFERYWSYGAADIESNYNGLFNLYSVEGYDPLYPRWYGEFIRSSEDGKIKKAVRSDAVVAHGFGRTDFPENQFRQRVLQALNVRFILDMEENQTDETTFDPEIYPLAWQSQGWRIHENKKAAPRVFLAQKVHFAKDNSEFEKIFFSSEFSPGEEVIFAEDVLTKTEVEIGKVIINDYKPNSIKLSVSASEEQALVLADTYYPGWKAYINNQETPIYKANYSFRGIIVPEGSHEIEFKYEPFWFQIGLTISVLSLMGWLILGIFNIIHRRELSRQT